MASENAPEETGKDEMSDSATGRMPKKLWVLIGVVAIVLIVVIIVGVTMTHSHKGDQTSVSSASSLASAPSSAPAPSASASSSPSATQSQSAVPEADKKEGEKLLKDLPDNVDKHLSEEARSYFDENAIKNALPEGTKIDVDNSTWTAIDSNTVMVKVRIVRPGETAKDFVAMLGRNDQNSGWQLLGTMPYGGSEESQ